MSPRRIAESGTRTELLLLAAGRQERPARGARARAIAAACLAASACVDRAPPRSRGAGLSLLRRLVPLLGLAGAGATICALPDPPPRPEEPPIATRAPSDIVRPAVPRALVEAGRGPRPDAAPPLPSRARETRARGRAAETRPGRASFSDELALLRSARRALSGGDVVEARSALARHARLFPAGVLAEEAAALRVELLVASGDAAAARAARVRFEEDYPMSPYAERLRAVVER